MDNLTGRRGKDERRHGVSSASAVLADGAEGDATMLLWEALLKTFGGAANGRNGEERSSVPRPRLPFDCRCAAFTKDGKRCKGKVRPNTEFCLFHDPVLIEHRKARLAAATPQRRNRLMYLPDGYLRKLNSVRSIGQAMDRLYREVRLGIVTPEMGAVLFGILTRLLDSGFDAQGNRLPPAGPRSRAAHLRPRLSDLLTRSEKVAWKRAVASAPKVLLHTDKGIQPLVTAAESPSAEVLRQRAMAAS